MPGQTMLGQSRPSQARLAQPMPDEAGPEAILSKLQQARVRTAEVRQALASASTPEEVGACVPLLHDAIACLQSLAAAPDPSPENPSLEGASPENSSPKNAATPSQPELAREFAALRFELGVARRLIEGGAEFYQGWARTLAVVLSGYTPSGEPAALTAPGSLSLQG